MQAILLFMSSFIPQPREFPLAIPTLKELVINGAETGVIQKLKSQLHQEVVMKRN